MLWLHVGPPKTGTSAIQAYLRARRQDLSAAGVFYAPPPRGEEPEAGWREVGNGVELGWWLGRGRPPRRFSPDAFERGFREAFVSPDHPVSLISSELIAGAEPAMLARFLDGPARGLEIGVVAFARDLYGHALSSWMHAVKHSGGVRDFEAYCRRGYGGPEARALRNLIEPFGRERVRVVHYDAVKDDIVAGFLQALGVEPPQPTRSAVANRGLSPVELEVAIACNRLHENRDGLSLRISRHIISQRPGRGAAVPFSRRAADILAERFGKEVAWINDACFGGAAVLRLEPDPPQAEDATPDVDAGQVWAEAVEALLQELDARSGEARRAQAEAMALRAMEKRRRGEAEAARRLASGALALDPDNAEARALLDRLGEDEPKE